MLRLLQVLWSRSRWVLAKVIDTIKHNKLRLTILLAWVIVFIVFRWFFPVPARDCLSRSKRWVQVALLLGSVQLGLIFLLSVFSMFCEWAKEGNLTTSLERSERTRKIIGLVICLPVFLVPVLLFIPRFSSQLSLDVLLYASLGIVFAAFIMDLLLEIDGVAMQIDLPFLIGLIIVTLISKSTSGDPNQEQWRLGFISGAVAFQLFLGIILPDPAKYLWFNIFPPKKEEHKE